MEHCSGNIPDEKEFARIKAEYMRSRREIAFLKPFFFDSLSAHYEETLAKLRHKAAGGEKIRAGFFVMHESVFPAKLLFEAMSLDPHFETEIILLNIYTDYYDYSQEQIREAYDTAYGELSKKYKNILKTWNPEDGSYVPLRGGEYDILCFESPYMHFTHPNYQLQSILNGPTLPVYVNYGYFVSAHILKTMETAYYNSFWKIFADSDIFMEELRLHGDLKGSNAVVTGYIRMDELADFRPEKRTRKRILLAPHHASIPNAFDREDANFYRYADFFLKLPESYPDIDFVFRPHPYAFKSFMVHKDWGRKRTEEYIARLKSYKNVIYSDGGEHLHLFPDTDGIIHDCGSFLCEYLFTGKPACYIMREKDAGNLGRYFNKLGTSCLEHCYHAFSEKDMESFIDNVIIGGRDPMEEKRLLFAEKHLKINWPFAARTALNVIKKELGIS